MDNTLLGVIVTMPAFWYSSAAVALAMLAVAALALRYIREVVLSGIHTFHMVRTTRMVAPCQCTHHQSGLNREDDTPDRLIREALGD